MIGNIFEKVCSCGKKHTSFPKDKKPWIGEDGLLLGFIWNCECGSTLFKPIGDLKDMRTVGINFRIMEQLEFTKRALQEAKEYLKVMSHPELSTAQMLKEIEQYEKGIYK